MALSWLFTFSTMGSLALLECSRGDVCVARERSVRVQVCSVHVLDPKGDCTSALIRRCAEGRFCHNGLRAARFHGCTAGDGEESFLLED